MCASVVQGKYTWDGAKVHSTHEQPWYRLNRKKRNARLFECITICIHINTLGTILFFFFFGGGGPITFDRLKNSPWVELIASTYILKLKILDADVNLKKLHTFIPYFYWIFMSADIMASLCGICVRVHVNDFSSKTTRPRDTLLILKDTLST